MRSPWWSLAGLAAIQVVDAALCLKPVGFIAQCFRDVHFPERFWPVTAPLKLGAAAGLLAGIWVEPLAVVTTRCLVAYFLIAVTMHILARDVSRNLFVNALGMLAPCVATLIFTISVQ